MDFSPVFEFIQNINIGYVVAGLVVGFIVGLTGVGGGSLMTPILLWFGITPASAVGTDLLYAAITKSGGIYVHQKKKNIDWKITGYLALGSLPAAAITIAILFAGHFETKSFNKFITLSLGVALVLTSLAVIFKKQIMKLSQSHASDRFHKESRAQNGYTILAGVVLGVLVSITSIGAGALGTVALFFLYPLLPMRRLVGTEIAHAVPLTLIAGLGHAGLGNVNWILLIQLLMGSLPGIYFGSHLTHKVPENGIKMAVAGMLLFVGIKLLLK